jgi:hypothetical protein
LLEDVGTIVQGGLRGRFSDLKGETITVITLEASQVRPIEPREIAHARSFVEASSASTGPQEFRTRALHLAEIASRDMRKLLSRTDSSVTRPYPTEVEEMDIPTGKRPRPSWEDHLNQD